MRMIRETGAPKVNIVARCLGGNVLSAYLQYDPNAVDKVETAVFYIPSTEGIGLFGQLFSGKLDITTDNLNTYVEENLMKFIIGQRPLSEWDSFQAELADLPIEDLLKIYEANYSNNK